MSEGLGFVLLRITVPLNFFSAPRIPIRSWMELERLIKNVDPSIKSAERYGFYSSHTVCLPAFLPDPETDVSWAYSFAMITFNFLGLVFVAVGHVMIFRYYFGGIIRAFPRFFPEFSQGGNETKRCNTGPFCQKDPRKRK